MILNSGQHDALNWAANRGLLVPWFGLHMDALLAVLAPQHAAANCKAASAVDSMEKPCYKVRTGARQVGNVSAYQVIWRGSTLFLDDKLRSELLQEVGEVAKERVLAAGISFMETAALLQTVPNWPSCCSSNGESELPNFVVRMFSKSPITLATEQRRVTSYNMLRTGRTVLFRSSLMFY